MREIKFRAWNLTENRFLTTEELIYKIGVWAKSQIEGSKPDPSDEIIFQQYTGLKDKNGVEIYEGDILEIEFQNTDNERHMINAEVVYDGNGFYEKWEGFDVSKVKTHHGLRRLRGSKNYEYNGKKFTLGSSEIIGNIFEGIDK